MTWWLARLADAYAKAGRPERGIEILDEALAIAQSSSERFYEAELHRLRGELLLALDGDRTAEAEAVFRFAVERARLQQARSLELRAVVSLSRLLHRRGQTGKAHAQLANVYGWFSEGLDALELREARDLLQKLAGTHDV
jgi:predicted ATPase